MIDLYLFNTIINTIWYIFTVLFVLYRFTSFFNYIYNFIKFCSKLFSGVTYLVNKVNTYIKYPNNYTYSELESQSHTHPTFFQRCKKYIKSFFYKTSPSNSNSNLYYIQQEQAILKQKEREIFDKQMNELYDSEIDPILSNESNVSQSTHFDFNSNIQLHSLDKSKLDNQYFNNKNEVAYNTNSNLFYSINLNNESNFIELQNNNQTNTGKILNFENSNQNIQSNIDSIMYNQNNPDNTEISSNIYTEQLNQENSNLNEEHNISFETSYDMEDNLNTNDNNILYESFINNTIRNTNLKYTNLHNSFISKENNKSSNKKVNKKFNYGETILKNPYI